MFGAASEEQREVKLKALDEQIVELEEKVKSSKEVLDEFETKALASVEKFNKQRTADITDIFITYIVMTLERCKKSRSTWQNVREACESM